MYVLGIETSCDETAASIVRDGRKILSNEVSSSLRFHKIYGGVVPEIASRMQLETITQVTELAVKASALELKDIDLLAVTSAPGLLGSLLVGVSFAKSLSLSLGIPLLGVNHLHSHIYANFLNGNTPKFPFVALVISGGHTSLFHLKDFMTIETLGSTQDDACGEAFDKVAKILGLGYPGGPLIEKLAKQGNAKKLKFGCSATKNPLDFSFSGIKTAVLYLINGKRKAAYEKRDIAASFQDTVIDTVIKKSMLACRNKKINRLIIGGGVAANNRLREKFYLAQAQNKVKVYFPPVELCMDNAAMVAGLGYQLFRKGKSAGLDLTVQPS